MVTAVQLNEIVRILVEDYRPEKIVLFGSYANGTANESSDLDLAIVKHSALPQYDRIIEARRLLRAGGRRWAFGMDILVYTPEEVEQYGEPHSFIHQIFTTGKTLYES